MLKNIIYCGDALELLKTLPDECAHMCVTSPPYYGMRDYNVDGQVGLEDTPKAYIYYDRKAVMEPMAEASIERGRRGRSAHNKYVEFETNQNINKACAHTAPPGKTFRHKRDIWSVSTNSYKMQEHYAMYPEKLIKPCILAGSPVSGIVLDLFFGSRTTGAATKKLGRHYLGIELKPEYCDAARQRIEKT